MGGCPSLHIQKEFTMPGLTPDQVQKIHRMLHDKQVIQAIRLYREATGVGLAEAKEAVEEMALVEVTKPPSGVRSYDDPVMESKIRSLLAKGDRKSTRLNSSHLV